MTDIAQPTDPSPEFRLARDRAWIAAQAMVRTLARTGSGAFDGEVLGFQTRFNEFRKLLSGVTLRGPGDSCKPGVIITTLTEDGQYGPQTSTGLYLFAAGSMRTVPPCRAADMPTWLARNADLVDAWVRPATDAVQVLGPTPAANTQLTEAVVTTKDIAQEEAGGAMVGNNVAQPAPAQPTASTAPATPTLPKNLCDLWSGSGRTRCRSLGFESFVKDQIKKGNIVSLGPDRPVKTTKRTVDPSKALCNTFGAGRDRCKAVGFEGYLRENMLKGVAFEFHPQAVAQVTTAKDAQTVVVGPMPEESLQMEATPVIAARTTGAVPILAIGAGALVLGGVLWAFTRKGRRSA